MKQIDVVFGWIGAGATYALSHYDKILAALIGVVTLCVMLLRLRREWKHRNQRPPDSDED